MSRWSEVIAQRLLDCLFPSSCAGCAAPGGALCAGCEPPRAAMRRLIFDDVSVWAAGPYAGALRCAILAYKSGRRDAGDVLASFLGRRMRGRVAGGSILVPVPTSPRRRRARGFDQGVRLAERAGAALELPVVAALSLAAADAQRGRTRVARLAARERFHVAGSGLVAGASIVLVDDVVTTGATLRDCALALKKGGATVREAVVLAYA